MRVIMWTSHHGEKASLCVIESTKLALVNHDGGSPPGVVVYHADHSTMFDPDGLRGLEVAHIDDSWDFGSVQAVVFGECNLVAEPMDLTRLAQPMDKP